MSLDDSVTGPSDRQRRRTEVEVWPPPADPMAVARVAVVMWTRGDVTALRFWRAGWMTWLPSGQWVEVERSAIAARLYERLEYAFYIGPKEVEEWRPNRKKVGDLLDALGAITFLPETVDPPAWLDDAEGPPPGEVVACANGLLHVTTRELHDHDPLYFTRVAVPFAYASDGPAPERWLTFLDELWPDDAEAVAALQEWFGYVVSGRIDLHKILLLVGPIRSGKGTIARVLGALVGRPNVAGPTLASLGTNFGMSPLLAKSLAVVSDARLGAGSDTVVERLLSISGEDAITVDRKYRSRGPATLGTRFVIISNELPQLRRRLGCHRQPLRRAGDPPVMDRPREPATHRRAVRRAARHPALGARRARPAHQDQPVHRRVVVRRRHRRPGRHGLAHRRVRPRVLPRRPRVRGPGPPALRGVEGLVRTQRPLPRRQLADVRPRPARRRAGAQSRATTRR